MYMAYKRDVDATLALLDYAHIYIDIRDKEQIIKAFSRLKGAILLATSSISKGTYISYIRLVIHLSKLDYLIQYL